MKLDAVLTVGWHDDPAGPTAARQLHQTALAAQDDYPDALAQALAQSKTKTIDGLEQLFRRRSGGFDDLKIFVGVLALLPALNGADSLSCRMDAFAYAFLKGSKNFDFLLPEAAENGSPFREVLPKWQDSLAALERFERDGEALPSGLAVTAQDYLRLRNIVARKTARDERRTLATLLVSGPSTREQLSADLGLKYNLSDRVMGVLINSGAVGKRAGEIDEIYVIAEPALPLVAFCLRETIGLDLLSQYE